MNIKYETKMMPRKLLDDISRQASTHVNDPLAASSSLLSPWPVQVASLASDSN